MMYKCTPHIMRKLCCCWKICKDLKEQNLQIYDFRMCILKKLDDIVNKYSNKYYSTIKMKPGDVKSSIYINFNVEKMMKILTLTM